MHLERIAEMKAAEQADSEKLMQRIQQKVFADYGIYVRLFSKKIAIDVMK
jgi:UDP-N-acetylenolpyruvoylglucosamine reductase